MGRGNSRFQELQRRRGTKRRNRWQRSMGVCCHVVDSSVEIILRLGGKWSGSPDSRSSCHYEPRFNSFTGAPLESSSKVIKWYSHGSYNGCTAAEPSKEISFSFSRKPVVVHDRWMSYNGHKNSLAADMVTWWCWWYHILLAAVDLRAGPTFYSHSLTLSMTFSNPPRRWESYDWAPSANKYWDISQESLQLALFLRWLTFIKLVICCLRYPVRHAWRDDCWPMTDAQRCILRGIHSLRFSRALAWPAAILPRFFRGRKVLKFLDTSLCRLCFFQGLQSYYFI